ncbi:hypothetical protein GOV14_05410 [Candidatus Pacearchaeota archaeon]|nr:hypothetical protein [Candidatus Pacearchaeota archaeon]
MDTEDLPYKPGKSENLPKPKPQSKLEKNPPVQKTALDLENAVILDLITLDRSIHAYIRPGIIDLNHKIGTDQESYIFRDTPLLEIKERFEQALEKSTNLRPGSSIKRGPLDDEVFEYQLPKTHKAQIYDTVGQLHKEIYQN